MTRMKTPRKIQPPEPVESMQDHPDPRLLELFLRGDLSGSACRTIVRHLLAGCPLCVQITGRFWSFGEFPADQDPDLVD